MFEYSLKFFEWSSSFVRELRPRSIWWLTWRAASSITSTPLHHRAGGLSAVLVDVRAP